MSEIKCNECGDELTIQRAEMNDESTLDMTIRVDLCSDCLENAVEDKVKELIGNAIDSFSQERGDIGVVCDNCDKPMVMMDSSGLEMDISENDGSVSFSGSLRVKPDCSCFVGTKDAKIKHMQEVISAMRNKLVAMNNIIIQLKSVTNTVVLEQLIIEVDKALDTK